VVARLGPGSGCAGRGGTAELVAHDARPRAYQQRGQSEFWYSHLTEGPPPTPSAKLGSAYRGSRASLSAVKMKLPALFKVSNRMVSATRPRLLNEPTPEETADRCLQVHPGSHPQGGDGSDPQGRVHVPRAYHCA
jgi:hypothetical protein